MGATPDNFSDCNDTNEAARATMTSIPILVSIPASNYVEMARWGLQLANVRFTEEKHAPIFHRFSTRPKGGESVPLLFFPETKVALTDSSDILDLCGKAEPSLYASADVKPLELRFDTELGIHTRRAAYFLLFPNSQLAKELIASPANGWWERNIAWLLFPLIKIGLVRFMGINEAGALRSMEKIERIVREMDEKLGDAPIGSRFLTGGTFTAADISFCAHMSLLLNPPENIYIKSLMDGEGDQALLARVEKLQQSKSAQFVYWCYKNKRPPMSKL